MSTGMARPAMGVGWPVKPHGITSGHGRREQAAGARRPEVEEALRLLDRHRTVTALELVILTKLTKHSIPVNLVGPQVSLPPRWVPTSRGSIHFFVHNKEALPVGPS